MLLVERILEDYKVLLFLLWKHEPKQTDEVDDIVGDKSSFSIPIFFLMLIAYCREGNFINENRN